VYTSCACRRCPNFVALAHVQQSTGRNRPAPRAAHNRAVLLDGPLQIPATSR
jgi:hypothetical protein